MSLFRPLRNIDLLYPYSRRLEDVFSTDLEQKGFSMDMKENNNNYLINADIPGIKKSDIKVTIDNDMLIISADRTDTREESNEHTHFSERSYGFYSRSIRLPSNANINLLSAKYENGVLNVNIPKMESSTPRNRSITIQ